jgi:alpha-1,6-mannosyltransferase
MRINIGQKVAFLAGSGLLCTFLPYLFLPRLTGEYLPVFLVSFSLAGALYLLAIRKLSHSSFTVHTIWIVAILARLIVLGTTPSLSNDVYRYLWDGHLLHQGINPYSEPVNSPKLDTYSTPLRLSVNHSEMASPYLPVAQAYFWVIEWLAPQQVKAYQFAAMLFDLLTGILIYQILSRLRLNPSAVLIYLWNPLVIVEFSHSAHVDAWMLFLFMLAFYVTFSFPKERFASPVLFALATLTKGVPALFVPIFFRRWRLTGVILYLLVIGLPLVLLGLNAGWGLGPQMDGHGLFGAIRIYVQYWQFNTSPLFDLTSAWPGLDHETADRLARIFTSFLSIIAIVWSARKAWRFGRIDTDPVMGGRGLMRLSLLPVGVYLLLSPTIHPWYVTWVMPFLPFFITVKDEPAWIWRWAIPWIYFSISVAFSYHAYLSQGGSEVPIWVLWFEYILLYASLAWASQTYWRVLVKQLGVKRP